MGRYYKEYGDFLAEHFPGRKMQKLTVDAGFSCPNRDGTLSRGGCAYCNNASFSPIQFGDDGRNGAVTEQLTAGKSFFARKYPHMRYIAYFQSYTNTHGNVDDLLAMYGEALEADGVDGIIIGTRPDCLPENLINALAEWRRNGAWIMFELGAESTHDATLQLVNRCHTWGQTVDAVRCLQAAGFPVGLHFIMGLPGENREMMLRSVKEAASLNLDTIKFHQLQIIRGSRLGTLYEKADNQDGSGGEAASPLLNFKLFTPEEYLDLCVEIIEIMNRRSPATAIERFTSSAPAELLLAPRWGLKNYQFVNLLHRRMGSNEKL